MAVYLQTDPKYANKFRKVWLWNEFPDRKDLDGNDTGIDIVVRSIFDALHKLQTGVGLTK